MTKKKSRPIKAEADETEAESDVVEVRALTPFGHFREGQPPRVVGAGDVFTVSAAEAASLVAAGQAEVVEAV